MYLIQKSSEMWSHTGYFWLQLIFLHSHLCRRWIFPVTQLETSLSSMTTLLVRRHGAHVPFHLFAAQLLPALPTRSSWWGECLAGGPESSSLILCLKLADMGLLTDPLSKCLGILLTFGFREGSLTWSKGRAGGIQGPRMSEQKLVELQSRA